MAGPRDVRPAGLQVPVWDLGVRLFHWALVADVAALWGSAQWGRLDLHLRFGFVALGLLVFRLLWGVVGGRTARFAQFLRGPVAVWQHLRHVLMRGAMPPHQGHNPAGGWAVMALLGALLFQVGSGLCAVDADGMTQGPLADRVGDTVAKLARRLHHSGFDVLEMVVLAHVAAVLAYRLVKGLDLVGPMLSGRQPWPADRPSPLPLGGEAGRLVLTALAAAGLVGVFLALA